jgi:hypothetical protein
MDLNKIIAELRKERAALNEALLHLEYFAQPQELASGDGAGTRKRKPFSQETRRKMALAQKKRWARAKAARP